MSNQTSLEVRKFVAHENLIRTLIFKQHHSIESAIAELVQNAHDAGASNVWITITPDGFTCKDDGKGFTREEEVTGWFEVFGAPHDEEESASMFGRFRMGRGQIMGIAATEWRSGTFKMDVDAQNDSGCYTLHRNLEPFAGCEITGVWYRQPADDGVRDTYLYNRHSSDPVDDLFAENTRYGNGFDKILKSLTRQFRYVFSLNLYVNGHLVSMKPEDIDWTIVHDDFYYKRESLFSSYLMMDIYNQGIHVGHFKGFGEEGFIVTRKQLKLNITRRNIQSDCPLYRSIKKEIRRQRPPLNAQKKYRPHETQAIIDGYINNQYEYDEISRLKMIHDIHGRKLVTLHELSRMRFTIAPSHDKRADIIDQARTHFIVDQCCIPERDHPAIEEPGKLLELLQRLETDQPKAWGNTGRKYTPYQQLFEAMDTHKLIISYDETTKEEHALLEALRRTFPGRTYRMGLSENAKAWTDGLGLIVLDRKLVDESRRYHDGMSFIVDILMVAYHEFCHQGYDADLHDGRFYYNYHQITKERFPYDLNCFLRHLDDAMAEFKVKPTAAMRRALQTARRGGKSKA